MLSWRSFHGSRKVFHSCVYLRKPCSFNIVCRREKNMFPFCFMFYSYVVFCAFIFLGFIIWYLFNEGHESPGKWKSKKIFIDVKCSANKYKYVSLVLAWICTLLSRPTGESFRMQTDYEKFAVSCELCIVTGITVHRLNRMVRDRQCHSCQLSFN